MYRSDMRNSCNGVCARIVFSCAHTSCDDFVRNCTFSFTVTESKHRYVVSMIIINFSVSVS